MALKKLKPASSRAEQSSRTEVEVDPNSGSQLPAKPSPAPGMSRYIPVAERKKVWLRDPNGCTYRDPKTGRVCGSKHGLQFDHVTPFSLGGANNAANLTLRCGAHNRYRAERMGLFRPAPSS
jgi:hypothetical protein